MDYDSLYCTFLCSSSPEECYLIRLLENHVGKFLHSRAEKGLGQSWKMPMGHNFSTGEFFRCDFETTDTQSRKIML